ncbi:MAG: acetyltransferase [Acidobacteria bacterium]|nr:MAG: acetyltransferase [Acidobacteriota bacterium]
MKRLVIVGAGGHGRGVLEILRARRAAGLPVPDVEGFVDDAAAGPVGGLPVLGSVAWLEARGATFAAVLAIASSRSKRLLFERLAAAGVEWAGPVVHPTAVLGSGTTVAEGAIVGAGVVVAYDTRIEAHTTINLNATVGHDCRIGRFSTVAPGVNITGNVVIGEGVEVQTNATVVPGITIGDGAHVGPGSVVLRDVAAGAAVFGNPARPHPRPARGPSQ